MASPELIAPGIYRVDAVGLKGAINVLLLENDDGWTLVDTGVASSVGRIREAISALGSGPNQLRRVFLTHHHVDHVGEAIERGASLVTGGERHGTRGFFYRPTVLVGVEPSMRVMREETFGPVVPIVEVDSLDEAIEQANSVPYGLGANVYTRDFEKMLRCMREIRAGTVWINDPLTDNDAAPFGGQRGSGIGRELGREGLEAFQESKHVHIDPKVEKKEWWYRYGKGDESGQRTM